jgi:nuclear transport factor 2 (NTF2) superfamily protein
VRWGGSAPPSFFLLSRRPDDHPGLSDLGF